MSIKNNDVEKLVNRRNKCKTVFMKRFLSRMIRFLGVDIHWKSIIGDNVRFCHNALGTVISPYTVLEDDVMIYSNVTVGRQDFSSTETIEIRIGRGAVLCTGCRILAKGKLVVGKNTIIAANAVLLQSTGDDEIWGGIPAKCIGYRN